MRDGPAYPARTRKADDDLGRRIDRLSRKREFVPLLLFSDMGAGSVTTLTMPAQFAVANPTSAPAVTWVNETANTILAGPASGAAATPGFRVLAQKDIVLVAPANIDSQTVPVLSQGDTSEHDLMTTTIPAGRMATRGDAVIAEMLFLFGVGGATKRVRLYWDGAQIYDSDIVTVSTGALILNVTITRTGAATQNVVVRPSGDFTIFSSVPTRTAATATLSGAIILKATSQEGAGALAGDVTQYEHVVNYWPVFA